MIRDALEPGDIRFNRSNGWTLPSFWLASAHMGDAAGLYHYVNKAREMRYADQDLIQFYESSGGSGMPFYTTSHGLFLQAVNDSILSDYWGRLEIGASCPLEWGRVKFVNFRTSSGDRLTGQRQNTRWVTDSQQSPV